MASVQQNRPVLNNLDPPERSRTYVFARNERLTYKDVVAVAVSERGTHRLELKDGSKILIPAGFLAIELDVDAWTF